MIGVLQLAAVVWFLHRLYCETGFPYLLTQCVYKSVLSIDEFTKSGRVFDSVSTVLIQGSGFLSPDFPTDKLTSHSYVREYDQILAPYQNTARRVLEVGVKKGGSLKLWREYFAADTFIVGMDIDPGVPTFAKDLHIKVIVLDTASSSPSDIARAIGTGVLFDVIIDDGCHHITCIEQTYQNLWPYLSPTGVYIIEDFPKYAYQQGNPPDQLFGGSDGVFVFDDDATQNEQLVVIAGQDSLARPILNQMVHGPEVMLNNVRTRRDRTDLRSNLEKFRKRQEDLNSTQSGNFDDQVEVESKYCVPQ